MKLLGVTEEDGENGTPGGTTPKKGGQAEKRKVGKEEEEPAVGGRSAGIPRY